jgi:hypothetical protein
MRQPSRAIAVPGLIVSWTPTILLGYFWLRWFLFFMSIEDYGDNDFGTLFHVAVGFMLTAVTLVVGLVTAILNVLAVRRLKSSKGH